MTATALTVNAAAFAEVCAQLREEGYRDYGGDPIDVDVAHTSRCPVCRHKGQEFAGFRKPGSYLAFTLCPECGYAEEF